MNKIRGIREFTVAISEKLKKNNWDFTSVYSRMKGMTFTLNTKLQDQITELNISQDAYKPEYFCQIALNKHLLTSLTFNKDVDDIEEYLNNLLTTLEKIRDCEIIVKK